MTCAAPTCPPHLAPAALLLAVAQVRGARCVLCSTRCPDGGVQLSTVGLLLQKVMSHGTVNSPTFSATQHAGSASEMSPWAEAGLPWMSCHLSVALRTPVIALPCTHPTITVWTGLVSMTSAWFQGSHILCLGGSSAPCPRTSQSATWLPERAMQGVWPVQMGSCSSLGSQVLCRGCQNVPEMLLWGVHRSVPLPSVATFLGADPLRPR